MASSSVSADTVPYALSASRQQVGPRRAAMKYIIICSALIGLSVVLAGRRIPFSPAKYVYENVLQYTFLKDEPFTHLITDVEPFPHQVHYSYMSFLIPTMFGGPVLFLLYAFVMSVVTGEWERMDSMRREALMSARILFITSPFLVLLLQRMFSCEIGLMYYSVPATYQQDSPHSFNGSDVDSESSALSGANQGYSDLYTYVIGPFLFLVFSDIVFYFTHRLCHLPWFYVNSHYLHHSCRPTTSFAGNASDFFEILLSGYAAQCAPCFIVPIEARVFMIVTLISHVWTIFLHNNNHNPSNRIGFGIYDSHDHNVHHYYGQKNYNFGLYFQFWDRVLGTYKAETPKDAKAE